MSGHSKWSKVKNQKAGADLVKGKLYTIHAKRIAQAVKDGRGLEQAVTQAKAASVPRDVIDRAVSRANKRRAGGVETIYDGFFANGRVALLIKCITDNPTRTSQEIRQTLEHHGAKMGALGSASYLFSQVGELSIPNNSTNLNLVLESCAQDYEENGEELKIYTQVSDLEAVASFFASKNVSVSDKEIIFQPANTVELTPDEEASLDKLIDALQSLDEVEDVFVNV